MIQSVMAFLKANPFDSKGEPVKQLVTLLSVVALFFIMLVGLGALDADQGAAIGAFIAGTIAILKGASTRDTVYPEASLIENTPKPVTPEDKVETMKLTQIPGSSYDPFGNDTTPEGS